MSNGSTPPDQKPTHAALPLPVLAGLSRLLNRMVLEGQEAHELLNSLQQLRPIQLTEPPEPAPPVVEEVDVDDLGPVA
jgi:hypothetical protein